LRRGFDLNSAGSKNSSFYPRHQNRHPGAMAENTRSHRIADTKNAIGDMTSMGWMVAQEGGRGIGAAVSDMCWPLGDSSPDPPRGQQRCKWRFVPEAGCVLWLRTHKLPRENGYVIESWSGLHPRTEQSALAGAATREHQDR